MELKVVEGNIADIDNLSVFNPKQFNIILNNVNCQGAMGNVIGINLKQKYPTLEESYVQYVNQYEKQQRKALLGQVLPVQVAPKTQVFNIFGQVFYGKEGRFLNYDAFYTALEAVYEKLSSEDAKYFDIYLPYMIGCDRSGGNSRIVEVIIEETIGKLDCNLYAVKYVPAHKRYEGSENYDYYKRQQAQQQQARNGFSGGFNNGFGSSYGNGNSHQYANSNPNHSDHRGFNTHNSNHNNRYDRNERFNRQRQNEDREWQRTKHQNHW